MRALKIVALTAVCVLGLSVLLSAGQNQFGVADVRNVNFTTPVRIGNVLLPTGNYQVLHTMEGDNHIMVFKPLNQKNAMETKVKCQLVPLETKADKDQKIFVINTAGERELQALTFRGDKAEHRF
jgi:hypothetical protein